MSLKRLANFLETYENYRFSSLANSVIGIGMRLDLETNQLHSFGGEGGAEAVKNWHQLFAEKYNVSAFDVTCIIGGDYKILVDLPNISYKVKEQPTLQENLKLQAIEMLNRLAIKV